ncbi:hypothetical protein SCUP234_10693 [Seiridium cupressi]
MAHGPLRFWLCYVGEASLRMMWTIQKAKDLQPQILPPSRRSSQSVARAFRENLLGFVRDCPRAPKEQYLGANEEFHYTIVASSSLPSITRTATTATATSTHASLTSTPTLPVVLQIYSSAANGVFGIDEQDFLAAPFDELCRGQDCIAACEDQTRLYQDIPDGISSNMNTYGRPRADGTLNMTLFGLCSNLGQAQLVGEAHPDTAAFFTPNNSEVRIEGIVSDMATCLAGTCELTRHPNECSDPCSYESLVYNKSSMDINEGVFRCINTLCANTCGLPYADRDTFGVGTLLSYFIQVSLVFICAVALLAISQVSEDAFSARGSLSAFGRPLKNFLVIQCFFGTIVTIMSTEVNPLTGYVLIFVAIDGFLCPMFTLMLLHHCGIRFKYLTTLTIISWAFSSGVFLRLVSVLSIMSSDQSAMQGGLREIFQVSSCGGSSAMMLCQQMLGTNPLFYMTGFYNSRYVPSLRTVPLLWAWSTVVLLSLVMTQCMPTLQDTVAHKWREAALSLRIPQPVARALPITISSMGFVLAIAYYLDMVVLYKNMDLIDWHGWDFGQVVAFLLWLPTLIELGNAALRTRKVGRQTHGFEKLGTAEPDKMMRRFDSLNVAGIHS